MKGNHDELGAESREPRAHELAAPLFAGAQNTRREWCVQGRAHERVDGKRLGKHLRRDLGQLRRVGHALVVHELIVLRDTRERRGRLRRECAQLRERTRRLELRGAQGRQRRVRGRQAELQVRLLLAVLVGTRRIGGLLPARLGLVPLLAPHAHRRAPRMQLRVRLAALKRCERFGGQRVELLGAEREHRLRARAHVVARGLIAEARLRLCDHERAQRAQRCVGQLGRARGLEARLGAEVLHRLERARRELEVARGSLDRIRV